MLQQGKYDALKAPTPNAEAVPQFLEDDTGEAWGGREDNLVKIIIPF